MKKNYKLELSSLRSQLIGMMECWNNGMLDFEGLKNEGWKGRRVEGEKVRNSKMRLKASKPCVSANSHELSNNRHFEAFAADTIHLKKPSVGPKGLIGPPCHGV